MAAGSSLLFPSSLLSRRCNEKQSLPLGDVNELRNDSNLLNTSEKAMATHSSTLAWKIPWVEEPGRLQSMGSQRVGHY